MSKVLTTFLCGLILLACWRAYSRDDASIFRKIHVGDQYHDVIELVGEPTRVYPGEDPHAPLLVKWTRVHSSIFAWVDGDGKIIAIQIPR